MNLYDRLTDDNADPQPTGHPRKWIGSAPDHCITHVGITPDSFTIEGVELRIADQPIRVEQLTDDLHIVHVGLYVEQINHDARINVDTELTYTLPPQTPKPSTAPSWDTVQQILADTLNSLRKIRTESH